MNETRMNFFSLRTLILCIGVVCIGTPCLADPETDELLQRAGQRVEQFWEQVPSFACTESVTQAKIGKKGKIEYKQDSVYDYLALTQIQHQDLTVEELRLLKKKKRDKPQKPSLLDTNGFPTLLLIFHPIYQANFRFHPEPEGIGDSGIARVRFEHIPGRRSTSALLTRGRIHPLELQGTAWIEIRTGAIQKISARLISPMKEINIESFAADVDYALQSFPSGTGTHWLPLTAVIELKTARQHWRNTHSYSGYKRFSVESTETLSK